MKYLHTLNLCVLSLFVGSMTFFSCDRQCTDQTSRTHQLSGFTAIDADDQNHITVSRGDYFSVMASGCAEDLNDLEVKVEQASLVIRHESRCRNCSTVSFFITMPAFSGMKLGGQCEGNIAGFTDTAARYFDISGQSTCTFTGNATHIMATVSGQADLMVIGIAQRIDAGISGQSGFNSNGVVQNKYTRVSASDQSTARVCTNGSLYANASGQSSICYRGNPVIKQVNSSGQSHIGPN